MMRHIPKRMKRIGDRSKVLRCFFISSLPSGRLKSPQGTQGDKSIYLYHFRSLKEKSLNNQKMLTTESVFLYVVLQQKGELRGHLCFSVPFSGTGSSGYPLYPGLISKHYARGRSHISRGGVKVKIFPNSFGK